MSDEAFDERWLGASIPSDHWHFHRQLLARYGIVMAPGEFTAMLNDITKGRALRLVERPKGKAIFDLIAAVREKYPEATKKEIVRAAFFSLSDGHDANPGQTGELYDFALKERAEDEHPVAPLPKRKGKRERNETKKAKASA